MDINSVFMIPDMAGEIAKYLSPSDLGAMRSVWPTLMGSKFYRKETKKIFYTNGTPENEHDYVNGQPHGKDKGWYESGHLWCETDYVNGQRHGKARGWSSDGELIYENNYVNGVKQ